MAPEAWPFTALRSAGERYGAALANRNGRTLDVGDLRWLGDSIVDALERAKCQTASQQLHVMERAAEKWVDNFASRKSTRDARPPM